MSRDVMVDAPVEVCVVGGGPAGSTTALRLARLGHRVCLVESHAFPRRHVGESLSAGVWAILDLLGMVERVQLAAFLRAEETRVFWAEARANRWESGDAVGGLLVDRGRFDALLVQTASTAGVLVLQPARARTARREGPGWEIEVAAEGRTRVIRADYLVDASGRNGFLSGRRESTAPRTVALCGYFEAGAGPRATLVEALWDGWCWGAPLPGGVFSAMVFLDPDMTPRLGPGRLEAVWREHFARGELFADLSSASCLSPVFARDATPYRSAEPVGAAFLKVGEAGFGLDPLSATGVEKAMQSGLVASTALHTMILWPEREELCQRFCRLRQEEAVSTHAAWAAAHYRQVARFAESYFWQARSDTRRGTATESIPEGVPQAEVSAERPSRLRLSDKVGWIQEPCIIGDEIRPHPALVHPSLPRPVAFVGGIELVRLLGPVPLGTDLDGLLTLWAYMVPRLEAERIANWMIRNRILEPVP